MTPTVALTSDQMQSIVTTITDNFQAAIPYGLMVLGIFLGFQVIKRVIFSFL